MQSGYGTFVNQDLGYVRTYKPATINGVAAGIGPSYVQGTGRVSSSSPSAFQAHLYMPSSVPTQKLVLLSLAFPHRLILYVTTMFALASIAMASVGFGMLPSVLVLPYTLGVGAALVFAIILAIIAAKI